MEKFIGKYKSYSLKVLQKLAKVCLLYTSIPAIEKLLKKDFGSLVGDLVIKAPGKPTLVPESDKRPSMGIELSLIHI